MGKIISRGLLKADDPLTREAVFFPVRSRKLIENFKAKRAREEEAGESSDKTPIVSQDQNEV